MTCNVFGGMLSLPQSINQSVSNMLLGLNCTEDFGIEGQLVLLVL